MNPADPAPYANLTPDRMLDALAGAGFDCDGRFLALNSYENRVYLVYRYAEAPVVVKFYRPGRWSDAAIGEEHAFAEELVEHEIPVVAPLRCADGVALQHHAGHRFAVYPRCAGRAPDLENRDVLQWMGRFLGRIHAVGATRAFVERPGITVEAFGVESRDYLLEHAFIPDELI